MSRLPEDVRASLRFFAFFLANGTVDMDLLEDVDYRPALMQFGSALEMVFTIFTNVLEVDEEGKVTNAGLATERAAQWIRRYCDPSYQVEPPSSHGKPSWLAREALERASRHRAVSKAGVSGSGT